MDPRPSQQADAFRDRVRAFLAEHLPAEWAGIGALPKPEALAFTAQWRALLHQHGLLAPAWPAEYGYSGSRADTIWAIRERT